MASKLKLRIVTPQRQLLDEDVEEVTAPGAVGEFGILPDHVTFLAALAPGRLMYRRGGGWHVLAVFGGYAEVADNVMTVLADGAELADEIDAEAARRAVIEAEQVLAAADPAGADFSAARRAFECSVARLAAVSEKRA